MSATEVDFAVNDVLVKVAEGFEAAGFKNLYGIYGDVDWEESQHGLTVSGYESPWASDGPDSQIRVVVYTSVNTGPIQTGEQIRRKAFDDALVAIHQLIGLSASGGGTEQFILGLTRAREAVKNLKEHA